MGADRRSLRRVGYLVETRAAGTLKLFDWCRAVQVGSVAKCGSNCLNQIPFFASPVSRNIALFVCDNCLSSFFFCSFFLAFSCFFFF